MEFVSRQLLLPIFLFVLGVLANGCALYLLGEWFFESPVNFAQAIALACISAFLVPQYPAEGEYEYTTQAYLAGGLRIIFFPVMAIGFGWIVTLSI